LQEIHLQWSSEPHIIGHDADVTSNHLIIMIHDVAAAVAATAADGEFDVPTLGPHHDQQQQQQHSKVRSAQVIS
jgi:hypothetical protein